MRLLLVQLAITEQSAGHNSGNMQCASTEETVQTAQAMLEVKRLSDSQRQKKLTLGDIRVLLFITTHLPPEHVEFLRKCWPGLISNSALLQHADVLLYTAKELPSDVYSTVFQGKNLRVERYENPDYQAGAVLAMEAATTQGWFDNYDWVIRVNPDVLILDDTSLIKNMLDLGVDGIFADCYAESSDRSETMGRTSALVNSDFFAIRPSHFSPTSFKPLEQYETAEDRMSNVVRGILENNRDRWIPGTNMHGICRIHGPGVPVLHSHTVLSQCPLAPGQPVNRDIE